MITDKTNLKIVFLGTPDFAVESLSRLHQGGYNIVGVVTMPDKPAGRGKKIMQSPVKQYAVEHNLNLLQPTNLKDPAFVEELRALNADLFVVIAFRMLPEVVWTMPPLGTFNLHASLLPKYRGAAPINWAVINGDTETGVTTFFLKHEIDTGDIIDRKAIAIGPDDNVGDIHDRLMTLGAQLTVETVDKIIAGTLTTTPQDELIASISPTPAPKIFKDTCRIDWTRPAKEIHNHIRGLSPYPAARTTLTLADDSAKEIILKIFAGQPDTSTSQKLKPGRFLIDGDILTVGCGDGEVYRIESLQIEGKKRMSTSEFLRGLHSELYCDFD